MTDENELITQIFHLFSDERLSVTNNMNTEQNMNEQDYLHFMELFYTPQELQSQEYRDYFINAFRRYDMNRDGTININEFIQLVHDFSEMRRYLQQDDVFTRLQQIVTPYTHNDDQMIIESLFRFFNVNNNGALNRNEVDIFFENIQHIYIDRIPNLYNNQTTFNEFDRNNDGQLDIHEFTQLLQQLNQYLILQGITNFVDFCRQIVSPVQNVPGSPRRNGSERLSRNGSETLPRNGSETLPRNGSETLSRNGSETLSRNGSETLSRNGSERLSRNGSETLSRNGSERLPLNEPDIPRANMNIFDTEYKYGQLANAFLLQPNAAINYDTCMAVHEAADRLRDPSTGFKILTKINSITGGTIDSIDTETLTYIPNRDQEEEMEESIGRKLDMYLSRSGTPSFRVEETRRNMIRGILTVFKPYYEQIFHMGPTTTRVFYSGYVGFGLVTTFLEFQSNDFQTLWAENFVTDCIEAYPEYNTNYSTMGTETNINTYQPGERISCGGGIMERSFMAISNILSTATENRETVFNEEELEAARNIRRNRLLVRWLELYYSSLHEESDFTANGFINFVQLNVERQEEDNEYNKWETLVTAFVASPAVQLFIDPVTGGKRNGCIDLSSLSKYKRRNAPPFPANECPATQKRGNDGIMYQSVANTKGVYRWIPTPRLRVAPSSVKIHTTSLNKNKTQKIKKHDKTVFVAMGKRYSVLTSGLSKKQIAELIFSWYGKSMNAKDFHILEPYLSSTFLRKQDKGPYTHKRVKAFLASSKKKRSS